MTGILRLFVGPMFAGKTGALIRAAMEAANGDVSLIAGLRPQKDARPPLGVLAARSGETIPARHIRRVPLKVGRPIVALDEVQLFGLEAPRRLVDLKKRGATVFVAGLNYDSNGNEWPCVAQLRRHPECDVIVVRGECARCGAPSLYTHRKRGHPRAAVLIGDADKYEALCQRCWDNRKNQRPYRMGSDSPANGVHRKCLRCRAEFIAPTRFIRLCQCCHAHIQRMGE